MEQVTGRPLSMTSIEKMHKRMVAQMHVAIKEADCKDVKRMGAQEHVTIIGGGESMRSYED